jgi:hypothetical protein
MCRPYIDTNNPQGMQLGRFKNRTPALTKCYIKCIIHSIHLVSILLHNKNRFTITLVKRSPGYFIFYGTVF